MKTKTPFTTEEKAIILKHIKVNATNLRKAFRDAAEEMGYNRTNIAIRCYWYRSLKKTREGQHAFRMVDQNGTVYSTKNVPVTSKARILADAISNLDSKMMDLASKPNTAANRAEIARIVRAKQALLKKS